MGTVEEELPLRLSATAAPLLEARMEAATCKPLLSSLQPLLVTGLGVRSLHCRIMGSNSFDGPIPSTWSSLAALSVMYVANETRLPG